MKWLENNFILVAALVLVALVLAKVNGVFSGLASLFGGPTPKENADRATAANHLHRPEHIPDGSSNAAQKAYAERMLVYTSAVAASQIWEVVERINPLLRQADLMTVLRRVVNLHIPLSSIEAEYLLFSNGVPLLTHLERYTDASNYRWFLSHVTSK